MILDLSDSSSPRVMLNTLPNPNPDRVLPWGQRTVSREGTLFGLYFLWQIITFLLTAITLDRFSDQIGKCGHLFEMIATVCVFTAIFGVVIPCGLGCWLEELKEIYIRAMYRIHLGMGIVLTGVMTQLVDAQCSTYWHHNAQSLLRVYYYVILSSQIFAFCGLCSSSIFSDTPRRSPPPPPARRNGRNPLDATLVDDGSHPYRLEAESPP